MVEVYGAVDVAIGRRAELPERAKDGLFAHFSLVGFPGAGIGGAGLGLVELLDFLHRLDDVGDHAAFLVPGR